MSDQLRCVRCRFLLLGLFGVALCQFRPADVRAAKFNRVLNHGDKAPVWNDLPGTDGKKHSLRDLKSADVVVVVFFCNHCPVAKAYEQRLLKLAAATREQSVQFALISVSRYAADNLAEMKKRAADRNYPFPYVQDASQKLARDYGAYVTPQVFVLDRKRTIAYMGAIDDAMDPDEVTEHYLRDAISAVLNRQSIEIEETKPVGCHIEFD